MPDLPDELRTALHEAAAHAPAVPPPASDLPRRVARRRAARATAMFAVPAVVTAGFVAVALGATGPVRQTVSPVAPSPETPSDLTGRYEFCDLAHPADELHVTVHPTELKFGEGCYVVRAGFGAINFANPHDMPHNVAVMPDVEEPWLEKALAATSIMETGESTTLSWKASPLPRGDYALICQVHPRMYAQLVVR